MAKKKKKKKLSRVRSILSILVVFGVLGLLLFLFVFAERYLRVHYANQSGPLLFDDVPSWVEPPLLDRVYRTVGGREFVMDETAAKEIGQVLESVAWLDEVRVLVAQDGIHVQADWRKPLAIVERKGSRFYVDIKMVVLEEFPLNLPLVEVKEVRLDVTPRPGQQLTAPDLAEALKLIYYMDRMDRELTPNQPLLREIDYVDMANYLGRKERGESHINLVAKDGTKILWGAEMGQWGEHMELSDQKKAARLYTFYKDCGYQLMGKSNFINLRDSRYEVPTPTRGY